MTKQESRFLPLAGLALTAFLAACGGDSPAPQTADAVAEPPPTAVPEAPADPVESAVEAMTEAGYRRHVETLASDEFGGRAPASPGEELTVVLTAEPDGSVGEITVFNSAGVQVLNQPFQATLDFTPALGKRLLAG